MQTIAAAYNIHLHVQHVFEYGLVGVASAPPMAIALDAAWYGLVGVASAPPAAISLLMLHVFGYGLVGVASAPPTAIALDAARV